jgi:ABC-2 type transport system permease protein
MRRDGFALAGAGVVMMKELADNLSSVRMRLLEGLVFVAGAGAVYATIGEVRSVVSEDPFVFLRLFTTPKAPLPSFVAFLGFLIPIVAIALGFDSVNSEFNHRTMSRLLAQPIYRDALLFGKFLAGLATLAITLTALWLFVIGLGVLLLGLPPSGEEVLRGFAFLVAAIAYSGVWLALALLFSVVFRSAATAALAALSVWLLFAFFWSMLVSLIAPIVAPTDPDNVACRCCTTPTSPRRCRACRPTPCSPRRRWRRSTRRPARSAPCCRRSSKAQSRRRCRLRRASR